MNKIDDTNDGAETKTLPETRTLPKLKLNRQAVRVLSVRTSVRSGLACSTHSNGP